MFYLFLFSISLRRFKDTFKHINSWQYFMMMLISDNRIGYDDGSDFRLIEI